MTFGDQLSQAISTIYNSVKDYQPENEYKQDVVESLASLTYTLLKIDNPDKVIDADGWNNVLDLTEKRYECAMRGGNPFTVKSRFVLKNKEDQEPKPQRSSEEIIRDFNERCDKLLNSN